MTTMNEAQFGIRIRNILNQGTRLDRGATERLRAARERALAAYRPQSQWAPAWAGHGGEVDGVAGFSLRVVLPLLLVAVFAIGLYSWQQNKRLAEIVQIDAELLTDDLPIDALLDRGFEAWLKKRAAR